MLRKCVEASIAFYTTLFTRRDAVAAHAAMNEAVRSAPDEMVFQGVTAEFMFEETMRQFFLLNMPNPNSRSVSKLRLPPLLRRATVQNGSISSGVDYGPK